MNSFIFKRACFCFLILCLFIVVAGSASLRAQSSFKLLFSPDSSSAYAVSDFRAYSLIETDIPGRELALSGSLNGQTGPGTFVSPMYLFQFDKNGNPAQLDFYTDPSPFLIFTPKAYGLDYDGNGHFYLATGSNNSQVLVQTQDTGPIVKKTKANHHEFYEVSYESDTSIIVLGQDESLMGIHDFSLLRYDSNGQMRQGIMVGTPGFDVPEAMITTATGYLVGGAAYNNGAFDLCLGHIGKNFELDWAKVFYRSGFQHFCRDICLSPTGNYVVTGYVAPQGGGFKELIFLLEVSPTGLPIFYKTYSVNPNYHQFALSIAPNDTDGYLIGGYYQDTANRQPLVMKTDLNGNVLWAQDYGEGQTVTDEQISDIVQLQGTDDFVACGEYLYFVPPAPLMRKISLFRASATDGLLSCGNPLPMAGLSETILVHDSTLSTPFMVQDSYPIVWTSALMTQEVVCLFVAIEAAVEGVMGGFKVVNPSKDFLKVYVNEKLRKTATSFVLGNLQGKEITRYQVSEPDSYQQWPLGEISPGIYWLRPEGGSSHIQAQKVLVLD